MNTELLEKFAPVLISPSAPVVRDSRLLMDSEGEVAIYYSPFEYINPKAKIVLVGITPGPTQMVNANNVARRDPFAALAIYRMNLARHLPFININSQFHRIGRVYLDEFSIVRFLGWAGFDVNATENPSDSTALQNFTSRSPRPSTNTRAVLWLLEQGSDPQAVNAEGDNALIIRARRGIANSESSETFYALMNFGGLNPFTPALDGATAYSLLAADLADTRFTIDPALEDLVLALDAMHAEMVKSGTTASTKFGVLIS